MVRAGHSFAHVNSLYPGFYAHQWRRTFVWSVALPTIAIAGSVFSPWPAAAVGSLYLVLLAKGWRYFALRGLRLQDAAKASALGLAAWFASLQGYCLFQVRRARSTVHTIIEYK
jgi:hypothetical protein